MMLFAELSLGQILLEQIKATTWLEWVGTFTAFICIYLAAKENIWNWPISIISVLAYVFVFFEAKLYADMALQFYFLFTAFYGWYFWIKKKQVHDKPVVSLRVKEWVIVIVGMVLLSVALGTFLDNYTDSDVPYADGTLAAMSFFAQILLTRKILENWLIWILVDILYVPLYLHKHLILTTVLYAALVPIAILGYIDWRKTYREQTD